MDAELVSIASDIAIGVSALIVAGVAFFGLRTWRRELTGKAKFDIARNVMSLARKVKGDFAQARHPVGWSWEYASRTRQENESPLASEVLDLWYAKNQRLKPLAENLQKLQEVSWEAEIVLGEDASKSVSEAFTILRERYAELSSAVNSYFDTRLDEAVKGSMYKDQDWLKELSKEIYGTESDNFSKRIDEATSQLDSTLKAYVK